MTFESLQPTSFFFREIQRKKMDIWMFQQRFQCEFGWSKVKYARITITHVCFIALSLATSLERCLSTLDRANIIHEKTCVPYIFN